MRDLYPAVIIGGEGSTGLPAQGVGISLSCRDGYRPSRPEPPNGDFDQYSTVVADGWRCQVASVSPSEGPPDYYRHRHH